jgi:hypothetical protein
MPKSDRSNITDLGILAAVGASACPNTYYTVTPIAILRKTDTIVGVGSVFLEQKSIRNLGRVGHNIAVDKSMQGRKLGLRIIQAPTGISEDAGCYKTISECRNENVRECHLFFVLFYLQLTSHLAFTKGAIFRRMK